MAGLAIHCFQKFIEQIVSFQDLPPRYA